jgi:uncharacterized NAD(P)/FAD-binding protein YdhS
MNPRPFSIVVIGAGLSGALLAVHLLRHCRPGDRIYLIEKRAGFGLGLAYPTTNQQNLLNVRAGNMGAFHDQPNHFVDWLRSRAPDDEPPPTAESFVSRRLYGTYVRSVLCDELWANGKGRNLVLVPDQVVALNEDPSCVSLTVGGGRCYRVDAVVLAAGNQSADAGKGAYFANPWHPDATTGVPRKAPVLLIGTGLTMVDTVQSLLDAGHKGAIHALSRRGLLPHAHAPARRLDIAVADLPRTTSVSRLARWLRATVRAAEARGFEWRGVIDGLRPHVQDLWRRLPIEERRRFFRHLRPWWEIHRHRIAPSVAAMLEAATQRGQLVVGAARIVAIEAAETSVLARVRRRGSTSIENLEVCRAINCSGLEIKHKAFSDPLIRDLLARGFARPDPLGLGLEVSEQCALLDKDGVASHRLFAVGPIPRGNFWEVTTVPDIRLQCVRLANHLSAAMRAGMQGSGADRKALHPAAGAAEEQVRSTAVPGASLDGSVSSPEPQGLRHWPGRSQTERK